MTNCGLGAQIYPCWVASAGCSTAVRDKKWCCDTRKEKSQKITCFSVSIQLPSHCDRFWSCQHCSWIQKGWEALCSISSRSVLHISAAAASGDEVQDAQSAMHSSTRQQIEEKGREMLHPTAGVQRGDANSSTFQERCRDFSYYRNQVFLLFNLTLQCQVVRKVSLWLNGTEVLLGRVPAKQLVP